MVLVVGLSVIATYFVLLAVWWFSDGRVFEFGSLAEKSDAEDESEVSR